MKYIECPEIHRGKETSLFLAGGITNCPDWQAELTNLLKDNNLTLLNPRRKNFQENSPEIEEQQISWEFNHLKKSSAVSFWFPSETLCPITLYELGKQSASKKPIFIGVHPNYKRMRDVEIQTKLIRPEIKIVYSLIDLSNQIKYWAKKD